MGGTSTTPLGRQALRAVLAILRATDSATGSEIMAATGLARPTVHRACGDLIAAGWARELPADVGPRPGRRPRRYAFRAEAGHVLGIDVGEHTARAAVADLRGDIVGEAAVRHRGGGFSRRVHLPAIRATADEALAAAGLTVGAVAASTIAVPAPVDRSGRLDSHGTYLGDLTEADLVSTVGGAAGRSVRLRNDANLAALAEGWVGSAQGLTDAVVVLAGERLGAAAIVDGHPLVGARGAAGELGFAALLDESAGSTGIAGLTRAAGARAVAAWGAGHVDGAPGSAVEVVTAGAMDGLVAACGGDPAAVSARMVFEAAARGDALAAAARDEGIRPVAKVLAVLQLLLDPAAIVLSGGVAQADGLAQCVVDLMPRLAEFDRRPPRLLASPLGERAVVIGAVRDALDTALADLAGGPDPS